MQKRNQRTNPEVPFPYPDAVLLYLPQLRLHPKNTCFSLKQKFLSSNNDLMEGENDFSDRPYIQMNVDGLKDAVVRMFAGDTVEISTGTFTNDITTFSGRDDVN